VTSFFRIKVCCAFFSKTKRRICAKFFSAFRKKHLFIKPALKSTVPGLLYRKCTQHKVSHLQSTYHYPIKHTTNEHIPHFMLVNDVDCRILSDLINYLKTLLRGFNYGCSIPWTETPFTYKVTSCTAQPRAFIQNAFQSNIQYFSNERNIIFTSLYLSKTL